MTNFERKIRLEEAEWWSVLVPNGVSKEIEKQRDERLRGLKENNSKKLALDIARGLNSQTR